MRALLCGSTLLLFACAPAAGPRPHSPLERVAIDGEVARAEPSALPRAARDHLLGLKAHLALSADDDFEVVRTLLAPQEGAPTHVKLRQLYRGVPVEGSGVTVQYDGAAARVVGRVARSLDGLDVTPRLSRADATAVAEAAVPPAALGAVNARLVVLPGSPAHLAFRVGLSGFDRLPHHWVVDVDARDGQVLAASDQLLNAQASGPGGNPSIAPPRFWNQALAATEVSPGSGQFTLEVPRQRTRNMNNTWDTASPVVGPLNPISDAAVNDAHGFGAVTLDMLDQWFGYASLDPADPNHQLRLNAHLGVNFRNAYWDPGTGEAYFGDGSAALGYYAYSGALDIVAHEAAHGFTLFASGLGTAGQSAAVHEGFSDIAGASAEFFFEGAAADWQHGEDVIAFGTLGERELCGDGWMLQDAREYHSGDAPHCASGPLRKAFCRAAKRLASGSPVGVATPASVHRIAQAWFKANELFWSPSADLNEACEGVMRAAQTVLSFNAVEVDALREAFRDVGLFCSGDPAQPLTLQWPLTRPMRARRQLHAAARTSGRVMVTGGYTFCQQSVALTEFYDPTTTAWSEGPPLLFPRSSHTATELGNGDVLIAGGGVAEAERYEASTHSFVPAGNLPSPRYGHTATLLGNGDVLVAGGEHSSVLADAAVFDGSSFSAVAPMATARAGHIAILLPSGRVLVAGGRDAAGQALASAELFGAGSWSPAPSMSTPRDGAAAVALPNGTVVVAGGAGPGGYLATCEIYDPATNSWTPTGSLSTDRVGATLVATGPAGPFILAGGRSSSAPALSIESFLWGQGKWITVGSTVETHSPHAAVPLAYTLLVIGGEGVAAPSWAEVALFDDNDGVDPKVDNCNAVYNDDQKDSDGDGVGDACDNCTSTPNFDQHDADVDGLGDVCD